jgi:hypothetical protein
LCLIWNQIVEWCWCVVIWKLLGLVVVGVVSRLLGFFKLILIFFRFFVAIFDCIGSSHHVTNVAQPACLRNNSNWMLRLLNHVWHTFFYFCPSQNLEYAIKLSKVARERFFFTCVPTISAVVYVVRIPFALTLLYNFTMYY